MSTTDNNFYIQLENNLQFLNCLGKTEEKQTEKGMELISLLKDVEEVLSEVSEKGGKGSSGAKGMAPGFGAKLPTLSSTPGFGSSAATGATPPSGATFPLPPNAPNPQEIAAALAALQAILANVQAEMKNGSQQEQETLTLLSAQLTQAETAMQNYLNLINTLSKDWAEYQQFLNSPAFLAIVHWDSPHDTHWSTCNAIETWVQKHLGITINLSEDSSFQEDFSSAESQILAAFNVKITAAAGNISNMMSGANNSFFSTFLNMIMSGQSFSGSGVLQQLEQILSQVVKVLEAEGTTNTGKGGPSNTLIVEMLSNMSAVVNQLQETVMSSEANNTTASANISKAMTVQAQNNLQHTIDVLVLQAKEEAQANAFSSIMNIITAIVTVIVAAVCIATGNFAMAAMVIAMYVMQVSGGFNEMAKGIADIFVDLGFSQNTANIIGGCITAAFVIGASLACGNIAGIESLGSAIGVVALSLSNGIQAGLSTDLVQSCVEESLSSNASQDQIQSRENLVNEILGGIAAGLGLAGGIGMSFGSSAASAAEESSTMAGKLLQKVQSFIENIKIPLMLSEMAGNAINGGLGIGKGAVELQLATTQKTLGQLQGFETIIQNILNNTNNITTNEQQFYGNQIKNDGQITAQVDQQMYAYMAEYAQLLAQGA